MHPRGGPRVLGELAPDLRRAGGGARLVKVFRIADVADAVLFVRRGVLAIRGAVDCVHWSSPWSSLLQVVFQKS